MNGYKEARHAGPRLGQRGIYFPYIATPDATSRFLLGFNPSTHKVSILSLPLSVPSRPFINDDPHAVHQSRGYTLKTHTIL